jgi:hypothetical protein
VRHTEKKKMGAPVMHTLEHWGATMMHARRGLGSRAEVRHQEKEKKRCMGHVWWTVDGPAAFGQPEVNSSFFDLLK